jgi:hypothetical protein
MPSAGACGESRHRQRLEQLTHHRQWADSRLTVQLRPRLRASFPTPANSSEQISGLLERLATKLREEPPE